MLFKPILPTSMFCGMRNLNATASFKVLNLPLRVVKLTLEQIPIPQGKAKLNDIDFIYIYKTCKVRYVCMIRTMLLSYCMLNELIKLYAMHSHK